MFSQAHLQSATQTTRRIFDEMGQTIIRHGLAPMMLDDLSKIAALGHDRPT
jgi:hypothetical protein